MNRYDSSSGTGQVRPFYQSPMKEVGAEGDQQMKQPGQRPQGYQPPPPNNFKANMAGISALAPSSFHRAKALKEANLEDQATAANAPIAGRMDQMDMGYDPNKDIMSEAAQSDLPIEESDVMSLLDEINGGGPAPSKGSSPMERLQASSQGQQAPTPPVDTQMGQAQVGPAPAVAPMQPAPPDQFTKNMNQVGANQQRADSGRGFNNNMALVDSSLQRLQRRNGG